MFVLFKGFFLFSFFIQLGKEEREGGREGGRERRRKKCEEVRGGMKREKTEEKREGN